MLSVVCSEDIFLNAHFTGVYILQRGCLLCLVYCIGCGRPRREQADVKHPRFFIYVVNPSKFYSFALDVCGENPYCVIFCAIGQN